MAAAREQSPAGTGRGWPWLDPRPTGAASLARHRQGPGPLTATEHQRPVLRGHCRCRLPRRSRVCLRMPPTRGGWLRLGSQWRSSAVATAGPEAAAAVTTRKCILFEYISESIATWMFAKHLEFFRISEHLDFFSRIF
jgi:hypothetical protein